MKLKYLLIIFIISILLIEQSCDKNKVQQYSSENKYLNELSQNPIPQKKEIITDSLIITIPGENGFKQPITTSTNLPSPIELISQERIIPGFSFLQQSVSEKLEGKPLVKSKKPETIIVDQTKIEKQQSTQYSPPIITTLPLAVNININNISSYKEIAHESGLISIQNKDSIFPPIRLLASKPIQILALPMKQKENALFNIRFLDADQGLPDSFIRVISKDKNGVIWFGTHTGGLISYNGKFFNNYTTKTGLSSDMVISLLIDKKDNLWIGTQDGGVNHFDGKTMTQYNKKQGLPSNCILDILEDTKGNMWFATKNGVSSFNGETITTYTTSQGLAYNVVTALCEDNYGNIWFGTNGGGVSKFNGKNFTTYTQDDGLASNIILSIKLDHLGNLWFGTNVGGVSKFDGHIFTNYSSSQGLGGNIILTITEDTDNNMWFGTFGDGITCFDGESFSYYTTKEGLSDNYVRTLFEDGNGNLLIGTDGGGVSNFKMHSFINYTKEQGLTDNLVLSILQDNQDRLWFGTFDGGLSIPNESEISGQQSTFTNITADQGLANNIVIASMQDANGDFWFGTYGGGVSKLDGSSLNSGILKFTNYSISQGLQNNIVRAIVQDYKGNIWFGTESGLTKFDGSKFVSITEKAGLGSSKILSLFQDRGGSLWIGTMGGGVAQLKNDSIRQYTTINGLGDNTVWTITQDHNGNMWFGTNGGGLTSFNGHSFETYNTENGLCNNYVYSLVCDSNNSIWAGTTRGLTQIILSDNLLHENNSQLNDKYTLINYGKVDGLKDIDFYTNSVFHDNKNRIWWGTGKALSLLDLNTFKTHEYAPNVQISSLIINDKTINFNELLRTENKDSESGIYFSDISLFSNNPIDLSLPYNLNHLTFQFAATYWSSPNQIQYQYKLKGFDNKWSLLTYDNIADYRNIPPGHFSFLVRAISKSGNWSKITEYPFIIRHPWWLSWWAILLYIFTFVFLFWLIIKWRVNIVLKQKYILENLILDRTKELDNALSLAEQATIAKSQFIATMSHEIRTPLNAILGFTHLAIDTNLNPKQKDYLQKIERSSITLLSLINDILDFSKIEAGKMQLEKVNFDLEMVLNSIIILNSQYTRKKNLDFVVNINPNVPRFLVGDPLRLEQVITNLCSNAIKFTSSGEISINIELEKEIASKEIYLKIAVADTGIGISKDKIPYLFDEFKQADSSITREYGGTGLGLTISKTIIEMMDGHIWVESELNKGTTFFFNCKVGIPSGDTSSYYIVPNELKELSVLVYTNEKNAQNSLVSILQTFSFNVDAVNTLDDVLKQTNKKTYSLLLIDQQVKETKNQDIINYISKNANSASLKIILINKYEESDIVSNNNVYNICKPFLPSSLLEKIISLFEIGDMSFNKKNKKEINLDFIRKTLSGTKILLVEDNETNQQVIYELLDKVDAKVDVAENGTIALKMIQETNYEIILMDLHMPVMDGYTASKQIRKQNIYIPIIAITADSIDMVASKCDQVGINDIITKPINPNLLYNTLLKWILHNEDVIKNNTQLSVEINKSTDNLVVNKLDVQSGIQRFGGNKKLYSKMLNKFTSTNDKTCSDLTKLIETNELEKAQLLVHTLKGESGNIAANMAYSLSQRVEQAILNKDISSFYKEIQLLETCIKDTIVEARKYFSKTNSSLEKDPLSIKELIKELIKTLKLKDPKSFDLIDELSLIKINKPEIDTIIEAVNNNDIKKALYLLYKLEEEI